MAVRKTKKRSEEIQEFILHRVQKNPMHIVSLAAGHFHISRIAVHRYVQALLKQGKLHKSGTTKNTIYTLPAFKKNLDYEITPTLSESEIWDQNFEYLRNELSDNVYRICLHGFTEMVNNAIDHSEGNHMWIHFERVRKEVSFLVYDDGIGIFRKIKNVLNLPDERDSVLQLTKGKFTTDPKNHSGEGIFFSSRAFDSFAVVSNGLYYVRDNEEDDWYLERRKDKMKEATLFEMKICEDSKRNLQDVFMKYSDPETYAFNKTHILVDLSRSSEDQFVSRSQAKRILMGLEAFKDIVLDFKDVRVVGQGFVDEVFRVYKGQHPDVNIRWVNANSEVEFMITRGLATANTP